METTKYRNFNTYLDEDHHTKPKEMFVRLGALLSGHASRLPGDARVLDIGCATGALIDYLSTQFPKMSFTGLDISPDLIASAREKVPQASFEVGSAIDLPSQWSKSFDAAFLVGVIGIFDEDEARKCFDGLLRMLRPGGVAYIVSQFNSYDVDVMIKYRRKNDKGGMGPWEPGWNNYSRFTVQSWCKSAGATVRFTDFEMPFPIEKREDNLVRTWTIPSEGKLQLTNGLKLKVDLSFAEIRI